jgi:hypothetical protein
MLSDRARAFVQAHRTTLRPDAADRARVLDGLARRLAEVNHQPARRRLMQSPSRLMQWLGLAAAKP